MLLSKWKISWKQLSQVEKAARSDMQHYDLYLSWISQKQPAPKIISIHVQATTGKTLCSFKIKCKTGNKVIPRNSHLHINDMKKQIQNFSK